MKHEINICGMNECIIHALMKSLGFGIKLVWLFISCMNWDKDLFLTGWLLRQNEFLHQKCLNQRLICSKYQLTDTLDKY